VTPNWLELHVDDLVLGRRASAWPDAAALVDRIARVVEGEGGALSIRIRTQFAKGDREGLLRGLVARGHEVGAHAHGRRLGEAVGALVTAGIRPTVMAPGLVQAGDMGRRRLLAEAYQLGARVVTDRLERRYFAYQGWLAWRPLPELVSMDVSVGPWHWGVLDARGRPGRPDWTRLAELREAACTRAAPEGSSPFFGATFHEHDVVEPGTWVPRGLDGLARYAAARPPVASGAVAGDGAAEQWPPRHRWRFAGRPARANREVVAGARTVACRRVGPPRPRGALVVVHGGGPGIAQGLRPFGLDEGAWPELAVWTFDRSDSWRAPGNPVHVADTRAVVRAAAAEGVPVGLLTWSAGLIPALLAREPAAFLVDVEGPVDRWSLVAPGTEEEWGEVEDPAGWADREAVALLPGWKAPYVRVQGTEDHQHGGMVWHARRVAPFGRLELLEGRVDAHGEVVARVVRALFR
jgi:hypothetical protein